MSHGEQLDINMQSLSRSELGVPSCCIRAEYSVKHCSLLQQSILANDCEIMKRERQTSRKEYLLLV